MEFIKKEKVRFQHVDAAGIVFYPRFLEMLNALVEDWHEEALDSPFSKMHITEGIPTVDLKVQFKKAARLGEMLTKYLRVINIGGASLVCAFRFENENKEVCLQGEVTLVYVAMTDDRKDMKAIPFTDDRKNKMKNYL